jgi:HEAT repeat protein
MLEAEDSALVLRSIASAFVDLHHDRAADLLPTLLQHEDPNVRFSVVHGLLPVAGPRTLESFIRASADEDDGVRNWATFGLRTILNEPTEAGTFDSSQLREALVARVNDSCAETRAEAILALATTQDVRALEPLKRELRDWPEWDHCIEAAQRFGLPELEPILSALLQAYPEEEACLRPAIQACTPKS